MTNDPVPGDAWPDIPEEPSQPSQRLILFILIRILVTPFQFNTNGKVIARRSSLEVGRPRMPSPPVEGHILGDLAGPVD
jgi:hypothetical protein